MSKSKVLTLTGSGIICRLATWRVSSSASPASAVVNSRAVKPSSVSMSAVWTGFFSTRVNPNVGVSAPAFIRSSSKTQAGKFESSPPSTSFMVLRASWKVCGMKKNGMVMDAATASATRSFGVSSWPLPKSRILCSVRSDTMIFNGTFKSLKRTVPPGPVPVTFSPRIDSNHAEN